MSAPRKGRAALLLAAVLPAACLSAREAGAAGPRPLGVGTVASSEDSAEITPRARIAIERGLLYLATTQREDGSWPGSYGNTTGIVGSCCLAFMGAGHSPGRGKYGRNVARGVRFIMRNAQPDGLLYRTGMKGHAMYHHGLATLALAEAWGMSQDQKIRGTLKRAVDRIIASQNWRGGWRYHPRPADDDISVTVMQLMALRACKDAGISVPKEVIEAGIEYIKRCHNPKENGKDGGFAYRPGGGSGFARTGAGVLSLQVAGDYRAKEVRQGVEYILEHKPVGGRRVDKWYFYGHYYAAQGVYQTQSIGPWGRKAWRDWYPAVTNELASGQRPDGSWHGRYDQYPTAMALLVLEIPYRYLPIYQR
jgi:hypothetical protein